MHNHTCHSLLNVCPEDTPDSSNRRVIKQQCGLSLCVFPASQVFTGCFLSVASVMQSIVGKPKPKQVLLNYLKAPVWQLCPLPPPKATFHSPYSCHREGTASSAIQESTRLSAHVVLEDKQGSQGNRRIPDYTLQGPS